MAALQTQTVMNSLRSTLYDATTGAGEAYDATTYAAGRAWAEAELEITVMYSSVSDAIDKAKQKLRRTYNRVRQRIQDLQDLKVVPISATIMPHIAAHIAAAQLSLPDELTRADAATARVNRRLALLKTGGIPAGPGMSWDEYPFASSYQGGLASSVVAVPAKENFIQGGVIAASYWLENITVGTDYFVVVIP